MRTGDNDRFLDPYSILRDQNPLFLTTWCDSHFWSPQNILRVQESCENLNAARILNENVSLLNFRSPVEYSASPKTKCHPLFSKKQISIPQKFLRDLPKDFVQSYCQSWGYGIGDSSSKTLSNDHLTRSADPRMAGFENSVENIFQIFIFAPGCMIIGKRF